MTMSTVNIEFASRAFVIEEGMLVLYKLPAAGTGPRPEKS
jgi:hypothetical protein